MYLMTHVILCLHEICTGCLVSYCVNMKYVLDVSCHIVCTWNMYWMCRVILLFWSVPHKSYSNCTNLISQWSCSWRTVCYDFSNWSFSCQWFCYFYLQVINGRRRRCWCSLLGKNLLYYRTSNDQVNVTLTLTLLYYRPSNNQVNVNVIAFITRHKVNIVDTTAQMVFLGGHPAKY